MIICDHIGNCDAYCRVIDLLNGGGLGLVGGNCDVGVRMMVMVIESN